HPLVGVVHGLVDDLAGLRLEPVLLVPDVYGGLLVGDGGRGPGIVDLEGSFHGPCYLSVWVARARPGPRVRMAGKAATPGRPGRPGSRGSRATGSVSPRVHTFCTPRDAAAQRPGASPPYPKGWPHPVAGPGMLSSSGMPATRCCGWHAGNLC